MNELVELRHRFPVLRERSYFASPCLGPYPEEMLDDLAEYRDTLFLRNRSLETWMRRMYELIGLFERFLNAPPNCIALRDSATAGQAAIAAALKPGLERNKIVIAPGLDFKSSRYLWSAQAARGFSIVEVGHEGDWISADELCSHVDETVAVVALPLVSPQTGVLLPLAEVVAHARRMGALTVIDAYQAVGIVPVDVRALAADVVVGGTHKWMCGGGMGLAFLFVRPELSERLAPVYPGWIGHKDLIGSHARFEPAAGAQRFQQGPPPIEPIYTARAGLRFLLEVGVDSMRDRSVVLTTRLFEAARAAGVPILTPEQPERRGGMLSLDVAEPDRIVDALAAAGIDVDTRVGSGIRVGPFPCLGEDECDTLVERVATLARG